MRNVRQDVFEKLEPLKAESKGAAELLIATRHEADMPTRDEDLAALGEGEKGKVAASASKRIEAEISAELADAYDAGAVSTSSDGPLYIRDADYCACFGGGTKEGGRF